jgi:ABC-type antimicrobial peptide transport system permease subunit
VVDDVKNNGLRKGVEPEVCVPFTLKPGMGLALLARTASEPMALAPAVRREVRALEPAQEIRDLEPLEDMLTAATANERFTTALLGVFALAGLVLAATGVYGVVAYGVAQRTHEIGIRLAIGARAGSVMRMVVAGGVKLVALGAAVGIAASFGLTRLIASQLYGVTPTDPAVFVTVTLVLMAVTVLACWGPARRATRVDPLVALREE